MPDNDDLSNFTDGFSEGMHVNPLPASEVRRRGDRMRRRNTTLATVGGVVAAAVFIGTPVALMSGNNDDDRGFEPAPSTSITPSTSPETEPEWLTEIPTDFPVTEGMVTSEGDLAEGDTDAYNLCDTSYPNSRGTADTQTWTFSGDGESSTTRTFQVWPDDTTAEASLDALVDAVQACPDTTTQGGEDTLESKTIDFDTLGDRTVTFVQQIVADDGLVSQLSTVEATRVGNAVLVDSTYGSAGGDEAITIAVTNLASRSTQTRDAMCVFSAEPCSTTSITPDPETSSSAPVESGTAPIPADFPLAEGLEDTGDSDVTGPGPDVEGATVADVCGTDVFAPKGGVVERLAALETGIEYRESRELYTFITADEPIEEMTLVRDAVRDCPHMDGEFYGHTNKILDGPEGYDSFTWGSYADEGLDGAVFQMTRVGSSILVVFSAGEMSESSLQPVADEMTKTTLELAQDMCVFTEDGC